MSFTGTIQGKSDPEILAAQFSAIVDDMKPKINVRIKGNKDGSVTFVVVNKEGGNNQRRIEPHEIMEQYHGCTESEISPKIRHILTGLNADPAETEVEMRSRLTRKRQQTPAPLVDEAVEFTDPVGSIVDNIEPASNVILDSSDKFQI